jgi:hypothetical protein
VANPAIPMALDSECAKTRDLDMATYLNQTVLRERNQTMESIEDHRLLPAEFHFLHGPKPQDAGTPLLSLLQFFYLTLQAGLVFFRVDVLY